MDSALTDQERSRSTVEAICSSDSSSREAVKDVFAGTASLASELQHVTIFRVIFRGWGVHKGINAYSSIAQEEGVSMAIEEKQRWLQYDTASMYLAGPTSRLVLVGGAASTVGNLRRAMQDELAGAPRSRLASPPAALSGHLVIDLHFGGRFADVACFGELGRQAAAQLKHLLPPPLRPPPSVQQLVEPGESHSPEADRPTGNGSSSGRCAAPPEGATAKSADAASATDLVDSKGLLSSISGLAISPTASPGGPTTLDVASLSVDSMLPPVSRHLERRYSTVSHSQQASAAVSLTGAAAESLTGAAAESLAGTAAELLTDAAAELLTDAAAELLTDAAAELLTDAAAELLTDAAAELLTDAAAESLTGAAAESLTDTAAESLTDTASESLIDPAAAAQPRDDGSAPTCCEHEQGQATSSALDKQLQASPNPNMPPSSAVQRVPRSTSQRLLSAKEPAFRRARRCATPKLTVEVQCTPLADVMADAYVLPTNCEADFTQDVCSSHFYERFSLSPPIGTCLPTGKCIVHRLYFCAIQGLHCVFPSIPDRQKLGESADELLCTAVHGSLRTADERGLSTVAMLPLGVYCGAFAPDEAARLTYRGILAYWQARTKPNISRVIVAVPTAELQKVYTHAFSNGFDVHGPRSEFDDNEIQKCQVEPEVIVTLCGTTSDVHAAVLRLVENVMVGLKK